ncbi:hypothetical protein ACFY6U_29235 [Streptomyces sp. NPDC013157]|uniref:hypothetical protein n=1 Tax=Streptomyces sp. NPDC013157 TaxID=3364861 RepID=UPI0036BBA0E1
MNDAPNQKKPRAHRGAANRSAAPGETAAPRAQGRDDEPTTAPGVQHDLPIQGDAVKRGVGLYQPYLQKSGVYDVVGKPGEQGEFLDEPPPSEGYGSDAGDPAPLTDRDSRGWHCPPDADGPCEWDGSV